ncbi:hypothetical protein I6F35_06445 [Bradyrhizobium sp. BRP22]|uniref:hypothetical protein n=1 Tax=Bradyrhizobium sp. BRP22 TaxID=2793821 RepID=UPI001CD54D03|nr:hypothetical protein [Bradyrhizobium sp. BRP22]MCA1452860.1 hypothetical protein [Bradyrhizobium sp. BRP22]
MIWRLMASVLVVSDAGSIALTSEHTDWPSERACIHVVQSIYSIPPTAQVIGGHRVTIKMSASCVPVTP